MNERRALAIAVQLIGFGICVAIGVWVVRVATSGEQAEALKHLRDISGTRVALLLGLSVATLMLNGMLFWVASRPARWASRVSLPGVLATNAVATMLSYLPFKLSAAARVAVHHRRDGVALAQMVAWFACFFAAMIGTVGPMAAVSLWRGSIDALWIVMTGGGILVCFAGSIVMARWLGGDRGHDWLRVVSHSGPWRVLLPPERVEQLHESFVMIACVRWLVVAYALRVTDMVVQAVRFDVASGALGEPMGLGSSLVAAAGYFGMLVLSPFGALGAREAGAVGAGTLVDGGTELLAATTLVVTGAEAVTLVSLGLLALVWIGPATLRGRRGLIPLAESAKAHAGSPSQSGVNNPPEKL